MNNKNKCKLCKKEAEVKWRDNTRYCLKCWHEYFCITIDLDLSTVIDDRNKIPE